MGGVILRSLRTCRMFCAVFMRALFCSSTFVPGTMQRLIIPGFIWRFPGDYKPLAFSHQRVIICFPADIQLQFCFCWHTTISMLCRPLPPSFLLVYSLAVLYLGWNTPCMVMSFLVPMPMLLLVVIVVVLLLPVVRNDHAKIFRDFPIQTDTIGLTSC